MATKTTTGAANTAAQAFEIIHALIDLSHQMNYSQTALARRLGVERASLYQYKHCQHTPRFPVQKLAKQLYNTLLEGLKGPLRATPNMKRDAATKLIEQYLDMQS